MGMVNISMNLFQTQKNAFRWVLYVLTKTNNSLIVRTSNTKLGSHTTIHHQSYIKNSGPPKSVTRNNNVIKKKRWVFEIKEHLAVNTSTLHQGL